MYYISKDQKVVVVYTDISFVNGLFHGIIIWAEDKSAIGDSGEFTYNEYTQCSLHVTHMQPSIKELN